MFRQSIWLGLLVLLMSAPVPMEDENIVLDNCCQLDEFTDMEYYILCETEKNVGGLDFERYYAIYGENTVTLQQGQEEEEFLYLSPLPFIIVEAEDGYKELEYYEQYENLYKTQIDLGYLGDFYVNEYGTQVVTWKRFQQLDILDLKTGEVLWEYPLDEKESIYEILQFTGNRDNGKIIVHMDNNMVYEINVPDGSRKLIGEDMYDVSMSPDGKYIVYSSAGNEDDMLLGDIGQESRKRQGIYVEELATGRTAYIDIELSGIDLFDRNFLWIPKGAFDSYLGAS